MRRIDHDLEHQSLGRHTQVTSLHFGPAGQGPKAYVQASLHAEELPGMLAAFHLRALLAAAEEQGRLRGEVVLVPVANPIGLAQRLDHKNMGRFELGSSENFNRNYPDLAAAIHAGVKDQLGDDATRNTALVRAAVRAYVEQWQPSNALQSLRKTLVALACDADLVLDLHCDCEAVLHLYTETPCWPRLEPLTRLLGARAVLLAQDAGGVSFDECFSGLWWKLAALLKQDGLDHALVQACASATVELRSESEVSHDLAQADAAAIFGFLQLEGIIDGTAPALPAALCAATPLAGSQTVKAPVAGLLVFAAQTGDLLHKGDTVAQIIDPIADTTTPVLAEVDGVMYARTDDRYVLPNDDIANIAGSVPFRTGSLLGA
jgi:uncharacterized protein